MAKRIVVFGAKGGVGKTLIASNLAISLVKDQMKRVCLLDLDLQVVGDMARMSDFHPQKAMVDLLHLLEQKAQNFKKEDFLFKSEIGLSFLPAVLKPQETPHLKANHIKEVINLLDADFDYIIIDAGQTFNDALIAVLDQANLILAVLVPDILCIYQTKWALDTLQSLLFPMTMVRVILNRAESAASISWQEVRVSLPADIILQIPSDGRVAGQAVNRSVPLMIENPRSTIAISIKKLAQILAEKEDLFIPCRSTGEISLKDLPAEKTGAFWQERGLTEPLAETVVIKEEKDAVNILKQRIHNRLIGELNIKRMDLNVFTDAKKIGELKEKARLLVSDILVEEAGSFIPSTDARNRMVKDILDEALGLGPLEDLLADESVTDIMVNNKNEVYVERHGRIQLTDKRFISNEQVKTIIERIIAPIGRRIDESVPMVDARLTDGSRVNAIIPPLALTGPTLTIRKFRKESFTMQELVDLKAMNSSMAEFIQACVASRKNIIVSGGTGSGKTTILNILSSFILNNERIITLEDAAELKLHQEHWVRLESRPPNIEGKGAVTIRDLFRNTLRMRPDRIIVGECRGMESLDMLQAMNTGHDGSMTTIHANSTQDVLSRLDSMILMSGVELPVRSIREMIASAIDIIVHSARLTDGSRKILQVTELTGMLDEMHIGLKDVFVFRQSGIDDKGNVLGDFAATGYVPSFAEELKRRGIILPENIFNPLTHR